MKFANEQIDELLESYRLVMGKDYDKYRNHVYRIFLNCLLIDSDKANEIKYAIASVFHDIGIWTNHTIDYLDPSIEQAKILLSQTGNDAWTVEIAAMIKWHHKITKYRGAHEQTVETFRKADWIDVTFGALNFGVDRRTIKSNRHKIPTLGFHFFLLKKLAKNFGKHPLRPLPMFKR